MQFNVKNFLNLLWNTGVKNALDVEVAKKTDFVFDDLGLQMLDKIVDSFLKPKELVEEKAE